MCLLPIGLNGVVYMARAGRRHSRGCIRSNSVYAFAHHCSLKAHQVPDMTVSIRDVWANLSDTAPLSGGCFLALPIFLNHPFGADLLLIWARPSSWVLQLAVAGGVTVSRDFPGTLSPPARPLKLRIFQLEPATDHLR